MYLDILRGRSRPRGPTRFHEGEGVGQFHI